MMLEQDEMSEVMTILVAMDKWLQVTDENVYVWTSVLNRRGARLEDAQEAAMRLVESRAKADATPGLLLAEVKILRSERFAAFERAGRELMPPDDMPRDDQDRSLYPRWVRAANQAVGDGATADEAMAVADREIGARRRLLGPSTGKKITDLGRAV